MRRSYFLRLAAQDAGHYFCHAVPVGGFRLQLFSSGCRQAANAKEVLHLLQSGEIDFLLLDTHLPGIEEEGLIQVLGAPCQGAAIPFMATSADASSVRIEQMLQAGACDYVLKPFSIPTLCARLETALRTVHANH